MQSNNEERKYTLSGDERRILISMLNTSMEKLSSTVAGLSIDQFSFRAGKSSWTIAECIEHVALAELRFPEIVAKEMKLPSNPAGRKRIKISDDAIRARIINRFWKVKSPEELVPIGKYATSELALDTFRKQRTETIEYILTTQDDLRNHFWAHRATGVIDLYQTIILMSGHLERHTKQIEVIKHSKRFPK